MQFQQSLAKLLTKGCAVFAYDSGMSLFFFYGTYKFRLYRRLCPCRATLALGFSSQPVNTPWQDLDRSPVLSQDSEILVAIVREWAEVAGKANKSVWLFWVFFKVWWFSSSGQGFSLCFFPLRC